MKVVLVLQLITATSLFEGAQSYSEEHIVFAKVKIVKIERNP